MGVGGESESEAAGADASRGGGSDDDALARGTSGGSDRQGGQARGERGGGAVGGAGIVGGGDGGRGSGLKSPSSEEKGLLPAGVGGVPSMHVVKRDGRREPVMFDKITARIRRLCWGLDERYIDPVLVAQKVRRHAGAALDP